MAYDSTERTPTPEFSYHTTPSHLSTPVYTPTKAGSSTEPPESASLPFDSGEIMPPEVADGQFDDTVEKDNTVAEEIPPDEGPTRNDPSDNRSDIFIDISEDDSKTKPVRYPPVENVFDLGLDLDLDLDLGMDYQYDDTIADDTDSSDSNTMLARKTESFDFVLEVDQEEEKEETSISEESTPTVLDRMPYFEKFMDAMIEYGTVKRLNNFLHKKMADYFKKRKMDHVLEEVAHPEEPIIKYGRKLDSFAALKEIDVVERRELSTEVALLREMKAQQCERASDAFQALLDREVEIGVGLVSTKTGKEISERVLERLISAQITKAQELRELRLLHITIRNAVADKNAAIKALDRIGENYTLIQFEQLKIENQSNLDKIEERDDELMRLRKRCQNAIQSLAHVREKCSATEQNIKTLKEQLEEKEKAKTDVREQVNKLKQERDFYRLETQRMKDENGLLTKDRLLIDMENASQAIKDLENVIQRKRDNLLTGKELLLNLRLHYESEVKKRIRMGRMRDYIMLPDPSFIFTKKQKRVCRPNTYLGERPSQLKPNLECYQDYESSVYEDFDFDSSFN